jgi:hypothetical protein
MIVQRGRPCIAALLACACAADPYRFDAPRTAADVELAPYALHEECVTLDAGQRFDFYFVSATPVAFNVHYHDANAVIMPIVREHATRESGEFIADHRNVYCLMWEAGAEASVLEYRVRPLPTRP